MRRVRPGATMGGTGRGVPARRAAGVDSILTSVDTAGAFGGHATETPAGPQSGAERLRSVEAASEGGEGRPVSRLWHITLSVSGDEAPLADVRRALEQLAHDHPFLLTSRYAADHAEIRYWEEARDLHDAAAVALRLWGEHRSSARLPPWEIVGLEVIDRNTYHQRVAEGYGPPPASRVGIQPF